MSYSFTFGDIKALANEKIIARGKDYFENALVFDVIQRGNLITAKVEGTDYEPYTVQFMIKGSQFSQLQCSCPYDWGGICKHQVATLLVLLHAPQQVTQKPEISTLVARLGETDLRHLLTKLAYMEPKVAEIIEEETMGL